MRMIKDRLNGLWLSFILIFLFVFLIFFSQLSYAGEPLVAVLPVEEGSMDMYGFDRDEILNGITQEITNKLVKKENIRVLERSKIEEVLIEQNFGLSGRLDSDTTSKLGEVLGVSHLITTTVTQMSVEESGGIAVGPLSVSSITAIVELTGRIVDTQSAEILDSFDASSKKKESSIGIDDLKGISFGSKAFSKSALGKSIDDATAKLVNSIEADNLIKEINNMKEARVVKILGEKLIINIGSVDGITKGQQGEIIRLIEVEDLDEAVKMPIGKVEVYSVNNKSSAIVEVIKTESGESVKKGDTIRFEN